MKHRVTARVNESDRRMTNVGIKTNFAEAQKKMARTEEGRREPKVFHVRLGTRVLGCGVGLDVSSSGFA